MKLLPSLAAAVFAGALLGLAPAVFADLPIDDTGTTPHNGCKDVCQKECDSGVDRCHCNAGSDCVDTGGGS